MTISHGRRQWGVIPQLPLVSSCSKWMMVCSLSPAMWCSGLSIHGPRRRVREHLRKSSNTLNKRNCEYNCTHTVTAQQVSFECLWRSPGQRFVLGVEETAHFSTARTWSSMKLFWWEGKRQRKDCIPLESFPATVNMSSAWPDWSKFQCLRSWYDPAEIRTTIYRTRSERSNY